MRKQSIKVINLWPLEGSCYLCNKWVIIEYFLPMYEGKVVDPANSEWAGCPVCKECHDKHA